MAFEDELKKMQQWRAGINAQNRLNQATTDLGNAASVQTEAQDKATSSGGLGEVLGNIGKGITSGAKSLWNAIAGAVNVAGGAIKEADTNKKRENIMTEASDARNAIAKKYGYNSYGDAMNDENASEDYLNEIRETNAKTSEKIKSLSENYKNSAEVRNIQEMDQGKYGADAIRAENFLADILTMGKGSAAANIALNAGQGGLDALASQLESSGINTDTGDMGNLNGEQLAKNALSSALGSAAAGVAGSKISKLAGNNALSKLARTNVGQGAIAGAVSGATSAGAQTALEGGSLSDVLGSMESSAKQGALYGGAAAGAIGLANKGLNTLGNKIAKSETAYDIDTDERNTLANQKTTKAADTAASATELDPRTEAKLQRKYAVAKQKQGSALLKQYGTIDTPTSRAVGDAGQVLTNLYDNYGLKTPADVQYATSKLTGADGEVSKMTRKLVSSAGNIPATYDSGDLDDLIRKSGLGLNSTKGKALKQQITSIIEGTNMADATTANANDVLDTVKSLEKTAADYLGKGGTYHRPTSADKNAARVLKQVAADYEDRIASNAADISSVATPEQIAKLKSFFPDNETYAKGIDNLIANSSNLRELRSSMADLVNGAKIVENSAQTAGTVGASAVKAMTSANPVAQIGQAAATMALGSDTASRTLADKYAKRASKYQAQLSGEAPVSTNKLSGAIRSGISKVGNTIDNAPEKFASSAINTEAQTPIGETLSAPIMRNAIRQNAVQQADAVTESNQNQAALEVANANYDTAFNNYNSALDNYNTVANSQTGSATSQIQSQLETIGNAMNNALAVGDLTSYSTLADLYEQAYDIYSAQAAATTSSLTSSQQNSVSEANNSLALVDQLEEAYSNAGGAQGFISGNLSEFANYLTSGNANASLSAYNALKESLGTSIIKNVVNLGGTEYDAQRYLAMLPSATDSAEQAAQKLQYLRTALNNMKSNIGS